MMYYHSWQIVNLCLILYFIIVDVAVCLRSVLGAFFLMMFVSQQVTVVDKDRGKQCVAINDPHMTTFDGR